MCLLTRWCGDFCYRKQLVVYFSMFFPHLKVIDLDRQSAYDIGKMMYSMYKMATAGVPSGTILAVHLQKCFHLTNEIRVMKKVLHRKTFMIYFLTFTGKIAKPWFAISLEKRKTKPVCLSALKNLGNQQSILHGLMIFFMVMVILLNFLCSWIIAIFKECITVPEMRANLRLGRNVFYGPVKN